MQASYHENKTKNKDGLPWKLDTD